MAEIVNLANFEINAEKAQQELDKLTKCLHDLGLQQKANTKENNDLQKSISDLEKQTQSANGVTAEESKQLENLRNKQNEVLKSKNALSNEIAVARREQTALNNAVRTRITTDGEALKMNQAVANALGREVTTINSARAANAEMIKLKNQLSPLIEEEKVLIDQLNKEVDKNTKFIKDNSSAMEQQKMNIGNYQGQFDSLIGSIKGAGNGLSGFTGAAAQMSVLGDSTSKQIKAMTSSVIGLTKSTLAFIATPIGAVITALVLAFTLIKNAMNQSAEATQKITAVMNGLSSVFKAVLKVLEPLGTYIIDGIVIYFEKMAEVAENAFRVAQKVVGWFSKDAADAMGAWADEVKESTKASMDLAAAEAKLEKAQRDSQKTMLTYQNEAEKLRQLRDDDAKSMSERIAANDALGLKLQEQMTVELALAKQAEETAKLRIKAYGETSEALDALAAAQTNIIDIEERITGQVSEQLTNRNSLRKEAAQKAKEARDKYYADSTKKINEQIALYIAEQGVRARTLEEDLAISKKVSEMKAALYKKELEGNIISRAEYDAKTKELNNQSLADIAEVTVDNAKRELDEYIRLNNNKYLDKQRLDADLLQLETTRLSNELAEQQRFANLQLEQGIINKHEFNDAMLALDAEYNQKQVELNTSFETTKREDEKIQRDLDRESKLLDLATDQWATFEAEKINADAIAEQKKIDLDMQRANGLISEANYLKALDNLNAESAKIQNNIDRQKQAYKLDVASQTANNLASILGKESAAGKAMAIVQTTIDTYKSATAAYSAMAGIPVVGPVLGGIAAGAAVVSGLKTVKEITATKIPTVANNAPIQGLATGGIVSGGLPIQRANGDNVLATLRTGEAVLNQNQRNFIGDDLLAASGMPLTGAASSTVGQGSPMVTEIANAVREASFEGTQLGSQSGAANGIIGLSENRAVQQSATF